MKMKTKANLNKLKVFLLAGLIGMASCEKDDGPNAPTVGGGNGGTNPDTAHVIDKDLFMRHLVNVNAADFYTVGEDHEVINFIADNNTSKVNKFAASYSGHDKQIFYPIRAPRTDAMSINNTAKFCIPEYWNYEIDMSTYDSEHTWGIFNLPLSDYQQEFANISNDSLASFAYNHIMNVANDLSHAEKISQGIKDGRGAWEKSSACDVTAESYGAKVGLSMSDFGKISITGNNESYSLLYSGGIKHNAAKSYAPAASVVFRGRAVALVNLQTDAETETQAYFSTDSAVLTIASGVETLVMPFKDWYTVNIVYSQTGNNLNFEIKNAPASMQAKWALAHPDIKSFIYETGVQDNGLSVSVGEQPGVKVLYSSTKYANDYVNATEVTAQAARNDWVYNPDGSTSGTFVSFVFGASKQK